MDIKVVKQENDLSLDCGSDIKDLLKEKKVYCINVMGSPGTGKTSLIIALIQKMKYKYNFAVVEGDVAGKVDAEKIDSLGIPVVQLNTQGECHIEPYSIKNIMQFFDLDDIDVIFIENIGNLICPAEYDIGEDLKAAMLSVPEGDDKVEKYPLLFSRADTLIISKYDMKQYFDFDDKKVQDDTLELNKSVDIFRISAKTLDGIDRLADYIDKKVEEKRNV